MQTLCVIASLFFASVVSLVAAEQQTTTPANVLGWASLLIPTATPILIAIIRALVPRIPAVLLPIAAPIVGALLQISLNYAGLTDSGTLTGILLGSAGVGLREILDQLGKVRVNPNGVRLLLLGALLLVPGCARYSHTRQTAVGPEETHFFSFLMMGKASQIKSSVKDGTYSRTVGVGSVEGQGDVDMLKAAFQAGMETGQKIATGGK